MARKHWKISLALLGVSWTQSFAAPNDSRWDACRTALVESLYKFYNRTQLEYNVAGRPTEIRTGWRQFPISSWEVPAEKLPITVYGSIEGTPLEGSGGGIVFFDNNGAGDIRNRKKIKVPGAEEDQTPASMQSSVRTFSAMPAGEYPYFIKFSWWPDGNHPGKVLDEEYLKQAVARGTRFATDPEILPDRAAVAYQTASGLPWKPSSVHMFLYRDGHFTRGLLPPPEPGDTLIIMSALLSENFLQSEDARRRFPDLAKVAYSGGKFDRTKAKLWLATKVGPVFGDLLFKSTFEVATHFELHAQNEDILFDGNGMVKTSFVRDLFDAVDDPLMLLTQGRDIEPVSEPGAFGYLNQVDAPKPADSPTWKGSFSKAWYSMWLSQIIGAANFVKPFLDPKATLFEKFATDRMRERFRAWLAEKTINLDSFANYPEYSQLFSGRQTNLIDTVVAFRELWIKSRLDLAPAGPDETIRSELLLANTIQASSEFDGSLWDARHAIARTPEPPEILEFGRLGGNPFARVRGKSGLTERYFLGLANRRIKLVE